SKSVPTASTTSASSQSAPTSGACTVPRTMHGWSGASRPRPMYVVVTGAASLSASSPTRGPEPDRSAPPPAQMSGRSAPASRPAAWSSSAGSIFGFWSVADDPSPGPQPDAGLDSRSVGTPRYTGPVGAWSALRPDSSAAAAMSST